MGMSICKCFSPGVRVIPLEIRSFIHNVSQRAMVKCRICNLESKIMLTLFVCALVQRLSRTRIHLLPTGRRSAASRSIYEVNFLAHGMAIRWQPWSSDSRPSNLFLLGSVKDQVYRILHGEKVVTSVFHGTLPMMELTGNYWEKRERIFVTTCKCMY